ncbi:hypothetical protein Pcinc_041590, partial [Petrolisthes cinctipes]
SGGCGGGPPTRTVSERDLTRTNSNNKTTTTRGNNNNNNSTPSSTPTPHHHHPHHHRRGGLGAGGAVGGGGGHTTASDLSRPSSAGSTIDTSPDEYPTRDDLSYIDLDNMPLSVGVVESVCEWVVEGCERLTQLWWRACSEGGGGGGSIGGGQEEQHHRALRSLLLGAAARATHALTPLTAPNAGPEHAPPPPPAPPTSTNPKDPHMVAMMQQYTDILVNMVQQKMSTQTKPPPGPT